MNKSGLIKTASVLGLLLLIPVQSMAHVALVNSMPENAAIVNVAPGHIMLEFTAEVSLLKTTVALKGGKDLDIGFKPVAKAEKHFTVALPSLNQGEYLVNWTVMGRDGHRMEASFGFTIDPKSAAAAVHSADHGAAHTDAPNGAHGDHSDGGH